MDLICYPVWPDVLSPGIGEMRVWSYDYDHA